jgi:prephenate dehydratase
LAELLSRERNAAFLGPEEILTEESLTALAKGINSSSGEKVNTSVARFFVLGNTPARETKRDRVSIICGVKEHAGALHEVLKFFAEREINLTKIESKMLNGQLSFFIDIDGSLSSEKISGAVAELGKETVFLKVLGSYPSALEPGRA